MKDTLGFWSTCCCSGLQKKRRGEKKRWRARNVIEGLDTRRTSKKNTHGGETHLTFRRTWTHTHTEVRSLENAQHSDASAIFRCNASAGCFFFFFFPRFPSDKPQVCLLTPLICLVWARSATQSTRMAHNEAGTVPGSPRLITVSAVMALHCCGGTMLLRPPCRSGRARPAFEVSFSLSVSDGLLVAPGMIDDADQEGKNVPVSRWVTPSADFWLTEWLS